MLSEKYLSEVGKKRNLDEGNAFGITEEKCTVIIKAIVGAVWCDCGKDIDRVAAVVEKLEWFKGT